MTWNTRVRLKPGPLFAPPALKSSCQGTNAAPIVALVDPHGRDLPPRLHAALAACLASVNYQARKRAHAAAYTRPLLLYQFTHAPLQWQSDGHPLPLLATFGQIALFFSCGVLHHCRWQNAA